MARFFYLSDFLIGSQLPEGSRMQEKKETHNHFFLSSRLTLGERQGRSEASPRSQAEALTNLGTARPASQEMLL